MLNRVVLRRSGGRTPPGGGGSGGTGGGGLEAGLSLLAGIPHEDNDPADPSIMGGPARNRLALAFRFPKLAETVRRHVEPLQKDAGSYLAAASSRWYRLTGEELRAPEDLVAPAIAASLWAVGLPAGHLPDARPGEEGPVLRANPLVAGLLYVREAGDLRKPLSTDFVADQLIAEFVRLLGDGVQDLRGPHADERRRPDIDHWFASHLPDLGAAATTNDEPDEGGDAGERYRPGAEA